MKYLKIRMLSFLLISFCQYSYSQNIYLKLLKGNIFVNGNEFKAGEKHQFLVEDKTILNTTYVSDVMVLNNNKMVRLNKNTKYTKKSLENELNKSSRSFAATLIKYMLERKVDVSKNERTGGGYVSRSNDEFFHSGYPKKNCRILSDSVRFVMTCNKCKLKGNMLIKNLSASDLNASYLSPTPAKLTWVKS